MLYGYDDGYEYGRGAIEVPYGSALNITKESTGTLRAFGGQDAAAIGTCFAICPLKTGGEGVGPVGDEGLEPIGPRYVWLDDENQVHEIEGGHYIPPNQIGGTINIAAGTIYATGGPNAAAIGCGREGIVRYYDDYYEMPSPNDRAAYVNISGGTIYAKGGVTAGAIGAGLGSCAVDVKITGGTIEATGDYGPAIGMCANGTGLYSNNEADISISGGNLKLKGMPALGSDGEQYRVATNISGGCITLEDDILSTFGGYYAEGGTVFNNIAISGGIVNASKNGGYSIDDFNGYSLYMQGGILQLAQTVAGLEALLDGTDAIDGIVINGVDDLSNPANPHYAGKVYFTSGMSQLVMQGNYTFAIPKDVHIYIPDNKVLTVNSGYTFTGNKGSFVMNTGQIGGAGAWPAKIENIVVVPVVVPVTEPAVVVQMILHNASYLGIVESDDNKKKVVSGNSIADLNQKAKGGTLLNFFSAGQLGFVEESDGSWTAQNTPGRFNVELTPNGALKARGISDKSKMKIVEKDGNVTVSFVNTKLVSPACTIFYPTSDSYGFEIVYDGKQQVRGNDLAFTIEVDPYKNRAMASIPSLMGSQLEITSISPLIAKSALRFGGTIDIQVPLVDIAGIEITQLQFDYNGTKATLGGLEAGGHVTIPSIAGMVSANAEANINTFPGQGYCKFSV